MAKKNNKQKRKSFKTRREIKEKAVKYKGGKCQVCGYNKSIAALTFHHINPNEKSFGISQVGHKISWEELVIELNKCAMLCQNCHIEVHEGVLDLTKNLEKAA